MILPFIPFIFLLLVKELECLTSCGCIELPGRNLRIGNTSGGAGQGLQEGEEEEEELLIEEVKELKEVKGNIRLLPGLGDTQTCRNGCALLNYHWHATVQGNCVCGWKVAVIECEEEIGPVIDVFCIIQDYEDNLYDEVSFYQNQRRSYYPTVGQVRNSSARRRPAYRSDLRRHIRPSNSSQSVSGVRTANNRRRRPIAETGVAVSLPTQGSRATKDEGVAEEPLVAIKDNKSNKILALVLGLTSLLCLGLAALKVYLQMKDARRKDKRKTSIETPDLPRAVTVPMPRSVKLSQPPPQPPTINNSFSVTTKL